MAEQSQIFYKRMYLYVYIAVNHVLDNTDTKIESVLADGAHDTDKNFQFLEQKGITPGIKVRKEFPYFY
jgi:hypothetical protein